MSKWETNKKNFQKKESLHLKWARRIPRVVKNKNSKIADTLITRVGVLFFLYQRSWCKETSSSWTVGEKRKNTDKVITGTFWLHSLVLRSKNIGTREWTKSGGISRSDGLLKGWGDCEHHRWYSVTQLDVSVRKAILEQDENWSWIKWVNCAIWKRGADIFCETHNWRSVCLPSWSNKNNCTPLTKNRIVRGRSWTRQILSDAWGSMIAGT